jgi:hypothetical protein
MVFSHTFNNISIMSWRSVLLLEETGAPGENQRRLYRDILYFTFLFSLFVFVSPAGQYNVIWTGACIIILYKKYNIANSSCHFGSYGCIWTGPSPKILYGPQKLRSI